MTSSGIEVTTFWLAAQSYVNLKFTAWSADDTPATAFEFAFNITGASSSDSNSCF
jgi:hypothetical protein